MRVQPQGPGGQPICWGDEALNASCIIVPADASDIKVERQLVPGRGRERGWERRERGSEDAGTQESTACVQGQAACTHCS